MKKIILRTTVLFTVLFSGFITHAQTIALKNAPENVQIDGVASEWAGYTENANDKAKVTYLLSYDKDNLYLVLKTKDKQKQQNIIGAGVTLGVDVKGKKRVSFSTTFPAAEKTDQAEYLFFDGDKLAAKVDASVVRKITTTGFKGLPEFLMPNSGQNTIRAFMAYSAEGQLTYEEAIPLKFFEDVEQTGQEWAFNIKINALTQLGDIVGTGYTTSTLVAVPAGASVTSAVSMVSGRDLRTAGAPGNVVGTRNPNLPLKPPVKEITNSSDFWGKFTFNK